MFEIYVPLCVGGTVILGDTGLRIPALPEGVSVSLMNTSPSIIAQAVREGAIPDSVQVINLAGELLRTELVDRLYRCKGVKKVFDLYGPTEDTTYSTFTLRHPGVAPSIGRPIHNTQVYLLDPLGQPVPIGVAGELHLGGAGLARGYWRRPELTKDRFIPNPFIEGGRLYRTGDLARYRPNGELEYLGRVDHQLKVNGVRIEPSEIETQLLSIADVVDAVVIARGDSEAGRKLVAYVVPRAGTQLETRAIRDELRRRLPLQLIPAEIICLSQLPRTPSGKLDRGALPTTSSDGSSSELSVGGRGGAPSTPTELALSAIWKEVLKLNDVGIEDDFFALGGHSLAAVQVGRRILQQWGVKLTLRSLFEAPTIQALARVLDDGVVPNSDGGQAGAPKKRGGPGPSRKP